MRKVEITINGKSYPCRQTMGAMLRFKRETGKEVTDMDGGSLTDICTFLWCCIVSACKADGIPFDMSLMEFADAVSPDDISQWTKSVNEGVEDSESDSKKKE